jgi:hypothetical protein
MKPGGTTTQELTLEATPDNVLHITQDKGTGERLDVRLDIEKAAR